MKKQFIIYVFVLCALIGCKDNSGLYGLLTDYDARISTLERLCSEMNTNISSITTIVEAQQTGDYITSITPIMEGGVEIGYTITFDKHDPITIYHGHDGQNGQDGTNGVDGTNGTDGHTPIIGVAQDTDGVYYWTLDGEWLLDGNGNKLRVTGENGQNGADGITPQLKIEADYWWISYDNGVTWTQLGKAKGDNGEDGQDGISGDSMFQSVSYDENYVYFTLVNGTILTLHKGSSNIEQTIIDNLVNSLTLNKTEIVIHNLSDNDTVIAITYPFANSKVVWSVSDSTIADIDNGIIIPKAWGSCIVTAKAGDKTATANLYISGNTFSTSATQKVYFSPGNLIKTSGNTYQFLLSGTEISTSGWSTTFPSIPNPMNNIENYDGYWRLLSSTEWDYIFNQRETTSSRYRFVAIGYFAYLLILPDNFVPLNKLSTIDDIKLWERIGCACLCGTQKNDYYVPDSQRYSDGFYWTSTNNVYFRFAYNGSQPSFSSITLSNVTFAVRLVQNVE